MCLSLKKSTQLLVQNQKAKVVNNSKSKAPELQILKRLEPNKQVLKKTESESQKPRFQRQKAVNAKSQTNTKGSEPVVWKKTRHDNFKQKTQGSSRFLGLTQEDPQRYGYLRQT